MSITLALSKGRIFDETLPLLRAAGTTARNARCALGRRRAALAGGDQALSRGEADPAVDLEAVAVLGHHDLGVLAAAFEVFPDPVFEFLGDARA